MNCRRVEKLIALYVEGDLDSRSRDQVDEHLDWCGMCNWLTDEYKESQLWLRSAPPEFDETFLNSFKVDVLSRIAVADSPTSRLAAFVQSWNRRQVLALATLIILFGVLIVYLYQSKFHSRAVSKAIAQDTNSDDSQQTTLFKSAQNAQPAPGADSKAVHHPPSLRRSRIQEPAAPSIAANALPQPSERDSSSPAERVTPSETDSREMLRIEIQTSDPNIRIIWFAPKESDPHQTKPTTD